MPRLSFINGRIARLCLILVGIGGSLLPIEAGHADPVMDRVHRGIRLMAFAPANGSRFDVSVPPASKSLDKIAAAIELIYSRSPRNGRRINALKRRGLVLLAYFPNNFRSRTGLNTQNVALFLPDFLRNQGLKLSDGKEFVVVINQFGVKWSVPELAAIIVHELVGHGGQHLQGRIAGGRQLDLECEASLHEEQAYQDFGVPKKSRSIVLFRRRLENRYCADFRDHMRRSAPSRLALWDTLNPDVRQLLSHFDRYRREQTASLPPRVPPPKPDSR